MDWFFSSALQIRVFETSAYKMGAGQISGYARAHEIGAIETRARHLRCKQARLDKAGAGQIDIKRPGLVQCCPIELGVREVRVVEPRGAQVLRRTSRGRKD